MGKLLVVFILILLHPQQVFSDDETDNDIFYTYKAVISAVYDGDTVTADIDLGFHVWLHDEKLRLSRINAPEVRGKERSEGLNSRNWLRKTIQAIQEPHNVRGKKCKQQNKQQHKLLTKYQTKQAGMKLCMNYMQKKK
jgi:endonuclease YncB( thermonuclease family)